MFGGAAVRQPLAAPQAAASGAGGPRRRSTRLSGKPSKLYPGLSFGSRLLPATLTVCLHIRPEPVAVLDSGMRRPHRCLICEGEPMHCYFNLVSSHKTI